MTSVQPPLAAYSGIPISQTKFHFLWIYFSVMLPPPPPDFSNQVSFPLDILLCYVTPPPRFLEPSFISFGYTSLLCYPPPRFLEPPTFRFPWRFKKIDSTVSVPRVRKSPGGSSVEPGGGGVALGSIFAG